MNKRLPERKKLSTYKEFVDKRKSQSKPDPEPITTQIGTEYPLGFSAKAKYVPEVKSTPHITTSKIVTEFGVGDKPTPEAPNYGLRDLGPIINNYGELSIARYGTIEQSPASDIQNPVSQGILGFEATINDGTITSVTMTDRGERYATYKPSPESPESLTVRLDEKVNSPSLDGLYDPKEAYRLYGAPKDWKDVPDIKLNTPKTTKFKYAEDRILAHLSQYLESTYTQHYNEDDNGVQCFDAWIALGDSSPTFRNTAIKYLWRYGKKNGNNKDDLMKALHYIFLLLYNDHYRSNKD